MKRIVAVAVLTGSCHGYQLTEARMRQLVDEALARERTRPQPCACGAEKRDERTVVIVGDAGTVTKTSTDTRTDTEASGSVPLDTVPYWPGAPVYSARLPGDGEYIISQPVYSAAFPPTWEMAQTPDGPKLVPVETKGPK